MPITIKAPDCFIGKKMRDVYDCCQKLEDNYLPIGIITSRFCKPEIIVEDLGSGQQSVENLLESDQQPQYAKVMNSVSRYK